MRMLWDCFSSFWGAKGVRQWGQRAPKAAASPRTHHVDLGVGVPHVADDAAVLHAVQVLPGHHVLVACEAATWVRNGNIGKKR